MASKRGVRRKEASIEAGKRYASCEKKIPHPTRDAAKIAQRAIWKKSKMSVYKCEYADHWHVGHWSGK